MTIAQLATETGFSSGYISSVERGHVNPSLSALLKLTSVLEIDPGFIFEGYANANHTVKVVKKDERLTVVYPGSGFLYELLTRDLTNRKVQFLRVLMPVGTDSGPEALVHEGEEYGLILRGKLELTLAKEVYLLEEGDSTSFQSRIPHRLRNAGDGEVEAVWAFCPPRL